MAICDTYLGHKSRCFDVKVSLDRRLVLTSSEEGLACLWSLETKHILCKLVHNRKCEVLRSAFVEADEAAQSADLIVTCGSDGIAKIWQLEEGNNSNNNKADEGIKKLHYRVCSWLNHNVVPEAAVQIYSIDFVKLGDQRQLLTTADEKLYLWNLHQPLISSQEPKRLTHSDALQILDVAELLDWKENEREILIFDAKTCLDVPSEVFLASSSGALVRFDLVRSVDVYCVLVDEEFMPSSISLTVRFVLVSLCNGHVKLVCAGTGSLLLDIAAHSRPCYGAMAVTVEAGDEETGVTRVRLVSWSSDATIRLWNLEEKKRLLEDGSSVCDEAPEICYSCEPIDSCTLEGFPVYSCASVRAGSRSVQVLAAGGKTQATSFLGTPVYAVTLNA